MKVLAFITKKVLPKNLMTKFVAKQLGKAPKIDCGIFSQSTNRQISGQGVIKDFIEQSGYTTISLGELQKLKPQTGKISGQGVIKDFIEQSGHTTISLGELQKLKPQTGKTGQC